MTTPVTATRPAAAPATAPKGAAPAANAPAAPAKQPAGDTLALSASAKATAPKQVVIIDGKEFEVREKKVKWNTWDKIATWGATGIGGVAGIFGGAFAALAVDFSGSLHPASIAAFAVGWAVCAGIGYLTGRGVSKVGNGVAGWFN